MSVNIRNDFYGLCQYQYMNAVRSDSTHYLNQLRSYNYTVYPRFNAPGGVTFCKKSAKRLFILFCQFLLGKKKIWGAWEGVFIRVGALNRGYTVFILIMTSTMKFISCSCNHMFIPFTTASDMLLGLTLENAAIVK